MKDFDQNGVGVVNGNIFALPFTHESSELIIIPANWDVTVSYGQGTANGPQQIIEASSQIDLFNHLYPNCWKRGIASLDISSEWQDINNNLRKKATKHIETLENGAPLLPLSQDVHEINEQCRTFHDYIKHKALFHVEEGKKVALIGGDHSTSLGMIEAMAHEYPHFGILQLDAHADLRSSYEGFEFSHASIMYNALKIDNVDKLVQVGIRDICQEEVDFIKSNPTRIRTFYDQEIKHKLFENNSWKSICLGIIEELPEFVYISFDIDALNPHLCPNTGTPVPGGLEYEQACYLIELLSVSGKKIIGFDLVEVSNGDHSEWDANVGMRLVYRMAAALLKSRH